MLPTCRRSSQPRGAAEIYLRLLAKDRLRDRPTHTSGFQNRSLYHHVAQDKHPRQNHETIGVSLSRQKHIHTAGGMRREVQGLCASLYRMCPAPAHPMLTSAFTQGARSSGLPFSSGATQFQFPPLSKKWKSNLLSLSPFLTSAAGRTDSRAL